MTPIKKENSHLPTFNFINQSFDEEDFDEEPKKRIKKRGNKKDDFDYGNYIKLELRRLGYNHLDANKKKKLI